MLLDITFWGVSLFGCHLFVFCDLWCPQMIFLNSHLKLGLFLTSYSYLFRQRWFYLFLADCRLFNLKIKKIAVLFHLKIIFFDVVVELQNISQDLRQGQNIETTLRHNFKIKFDKVIFLLNLNFWTIKNNLILIIILAKLLKSSLYKFQIWGLKFMCINFL